MGSTKSNNSSPKDKNSIVNISFTDTGHQKLKEVHSHIKDLLSKGGNKNDLTEIFFSLSYFFENYLLKEELFLKKTGYPNLENHSSSHKMFMTKIEKLKDSVDKDAKVVLNELDSFIDVWLRDHEASYSDEMVNFLKKKGFDY